MPPISAVPAPPTEVASRPQRRVFSLDYKRRILREADACHRPGDVGALLRREALHSSHLTQWRDARDRGELVGESRPRGPKPLPLDPSALRIAELEVLVAHLELRASRAEALLELQKKVAELLSISTPLPRAKR